MLLAWLRHVTSQAWLIFEVGDQVEFRLRSACVRNSGARAYAH